MGMNYKYKSDIEDDMASLLHGIQNEPVLDTINGQYKVIDDNTANTEVLSDFINWSLYGIDNKTKDKKALLPLKFKLWLTISIFFFLLIFFKAFKKKKPSKKSFEKDVCKLKLAKSVTWSDAVL